MSNSQVMNLNDAISTQRRTVCAHCWGELIAPETEKNSRLFHVQCPVCGTGKGFHSRSYVKFRQSQSREEYIEARENLRGVMPEAFRIDETPEQIIKNFGF